MEARQEVVCGWRNVGRMEGVRNVLKVSEPNKSAKERTYQKRLLGKYEVLSGVDVASVDTEWEMFRDIVK